MIDLPHRVAARVGIEALLIGLDQRVGLGRAEAPKIIVVLGLFEFGAEILPRFRIKPRRHSEVDHFEFALQGALKHRTRLQELQLHIDSGASKILLHDRQMGLQPFGGVHECEACLLALVVDQDVVRIGPGK